MSERYNRFYTFKSNLYIPGAPVVIQAGALLLDNLNKNILTQIKYMNVQNKPIISLKVEIVAYDSANRALGEAIEYQYLDLSATRDTEFGSKSLIPMPDKATRAFGVAVTEVVFADQTIWSAPLDTWAPIAQQEMLSDWLQDPFRERAYRTQFGKSANFKPLEHEDIWYCTCGSVNRREETECHHCHASLAACASVDFDVLYQSGVYAKAVQFMASTNLQDVKKAQELFEKILGWENAAQLATECAQKQIALKNQNDRQSKKIKIISISAGVALAAIIAFVIILLNVILPTNNYNKAMALIDAGKDAEAYLLLLNYPDFKDTDEQISSIQKRAIAKADTYAARGKYGQAYDVLTSVGFTTDNMPILTAYKNAISGNFQGAVDNGITEFVIADGVTHIKDGAFENCKALVSVSIPDSVTGIGENAFAGCESLTDVTLPKSVLLIGAGAFKDCTALESITIPNGVDIVVTSTFFGCDNLQSVTLGSNVKIIADYAFYNCNRLTNITIPNSVTNIGGHAFDGCTTLASITIPYSITEIDDYAFRGCEKLTTVTIGSGVTQIGKGAFAGCAQLTSITIPNNVTSIGEGAFSGCANLSSITIPFIGGSSATEANKSTLFGYIFGASKYTGGVSIKQYYNSSSYQSYYIPEKLQSVTVTGGKVLYGAFCSCTNLTSITLPDNLTRISDNAFQNCSGLTGITIPESVTSIGANAFQNCSGITTITVPQKVTSIGESAFEGCGKLSSITLPFVGDQKNSPSKTHFGYIFGAYNANTNGSYVPTMLKTVVITKGTSIGTSAFSGCKNLTSITLPNSLKSIGDYAFSDCTNLKNLAIPNQVTSIGNSAFQNCTQFTDISLPNSITYIGDYAFYGCKRLANVNIPYGVTSINNGTFAGCSSLLEIAIPNSVTNIGNSAFSGCESLTSITIPEKVTTLGTSAFSECIALTKIGFYATSMNDLSSDNGVFAGAGQSREGISVTIGVNVTKIPDYLFCPDSNAKTPKISKITSVEFSNNSVCKSIGKASFEYCANLSSITLPDSITNIGNAAFSNCTGLTNAILSEGVLCIESSAFYNCAGLKTITIPSSVTSIGEGAFIYCTSLESIVLPFLGATKDGTINTDFEYIFKQRVPTSLKSVVLTGGTKIPSGAFAFCEDIESITIPNSVISIESKAFQYCTNLTSITIPNSVTSIGSWAFEQCKHLKSIIIPPSITSIGAFAFNGCSSLNVYITDVISWLNISFEDKYARPNYYGSLHLINAAGEEITELVIPTGVTNLDEFAFYQCNNFKSITIPDTVTTIGEDAFRYCSSLTSVTIPDSVTSIGEDAFYKCSSLTSVYYGGTASDWNGISIGSFNYDLTSATRYYYSETQPTTAGNYWHYVNGVPTKW